MTVEPGHGMAPLAYGQMRAAQADRERAVDVLKAAFAEGRLDKDEYDGRVGEVYTSRTYAELATLTADLPAGPLGTLEPQTVPEMPDRAARPHRSVSRRRRGSPLPFFMLLVFLLVLTRGDLAAGRVGVVLILGLVFLLIRRHR